jgi:hypothetical protein
MSERFATDWAFVMPQIETLAILVPHRGLCVLVVYRHP